MKKKDVLQSIMEGRQIMEDHKTSPRVCDFTQIAEFSGGKILALFEMAYSAGFERGYTAAKKDVKRKDGKDGKGRNDR